MYCSEKVSSKSDIFTCWSEDLSKERDNSDKCHLHQNQTVLKKHNLDKAVIQDFQNNVAAQKLNQEVVSTLAHEIEFITVSIHCQLMRLQSLQLHLNSKKFFCLYVIHLASVFTEQENELESLDSFDDESNKSQLDINTNQLHSDEDSTETSTQLLWNQVTERDHFASQILIMLDNDTCYCSRILLTECENQNDILYFKNHKYVFNSDHLHFWIIQLAHDSTADDHSDHEKCFELIFRVY